tara:strand:- start:1087 stop:1803 length:717 start_codon:yes stop_codon:yes gene_type:complete
MYKIILIFCLISSHQLFAQINLLKEVSEKANALVKGENPLSEDQVKKGLVEALIKGSEKSVQSASKKDGFNLNKSIKIPFPEDAKKMKSTLVKMGFSDQVIKFEKSINNAAELASKEALPIFVNAVKSMTINDAFSILNGDDNSATVYLKDQTSSSLYTKFKPIISNAISNVDVTKYWSDLTSAYNKVPFVKPINTDLDDYITKGAMYGLFFLIEQEEKNIRNNPTARTTEILKKVFK